MTSPKFFLLLATLVAGIAPDALAQELAEPPRTLAQAEPVEIEAELPIGDVVDAASNALSEALPGESQSAEPAPPLEDRPLQIEPRDPLEDDSEREAEIAGMPEFSADDFRTTLQILRRLGRKVGDGLAQVDAIAVRLADPVSANMLNLHPYVSDPAWKAVVTMLYDDKCKDAQSKMRALVGEPKASDAPALQYMWARIQMCGSDAAEGKKRLAALVKTGGPIGVLAARRLGDNVTVVVDAEGEEGAYLSTRIGQAKRSKSVDTALRELDELRGEMRSSSDRLRVERARADVLLGAKRYDEAAAAYLALYRKTRNSSINGAIEDQIEALERKTKKNILSYGERIDRMRSLVARGRYSEAKNVSIENAKIRGVSGSEIRGWTYFRQALQAEREKKRGEAIELFQKADGLVKDSEVRPRLYVGWARALRRTDRDADAIALYTRLCTEFVGHSLCDEAKYEAGRLLQFQNKHARAIEHFDAVIKDYPNSEYVADSLWRKAFSHYLGGEYAKMRAPLERLRTEFGDERDSSELTLGLKATYWLGMSRLKGGDRPEAERLLQETVDRGPLTWYGRLAAVRMTEAGWTASVTLPSQRLGADDLRNLATLRVPQSVRLGVAGELVRLGLWKDALAEMRTQTSIHPVPDGANRLLAATYLANDRPDWAHWIMKKQIVESGPTWSTLRDWGTAFPLDYMDLSHEHGTKAGVSPFLVQAIIRQESGFRPTVASWAGAVGLMQLMPGTAAYTARVFRDEQTKFKLSELKTPERNVSLGARYIRLHTAHAADSIPLALAGYNAGPRPLESWIERYSDRELDAWVESITFQEARGYVRKVYTSYVTYAALYGGELPTPDLHVPARLRAWGTVPEVVRTKPGQPVSMLID